MSLFKSSPRQFAIPVRLRLIVHFVLLLMFLLLGCDSGSECGDGYCDYDEDAYDCPADCAVCGDAICSYNESASGCPQDCVYCGNRACDGDEDSDSCREDCPVCGDGVCGRGENVENCPADCESCFDTVCSGTESLTGNCPMDCAVCGDGLCSSGETFFACPQDCGNCPAVLDTAVCGNGNCEFSETFSTCPQDCYNRPELFGSSTRCAEVYDCEYVGQSADGTHIYQWGQAVVRYNIDGIVVETLIVDGPITGPWQPGCVAHEECGDGQCVGLENNENCPADCPVCGNAVCEGNETATCPQDCGGEVCGDGFCGVGENNANCPQDCTCGDGLCSDNETCDSCPGDCGDCPAPDPDPGPFCGDDICNGDENPDTCAADCFCGNGTCDPEEGPGGDFECPEDCEGFG